MARAALVSEVLDILEIRNYVQKCNVVGQKESKVRVA